MFQVLAPDRRRDPRSRAGAPREGAHADQLVEALRARRGLLPRLAGRTQRRLPAP